jgi:hypothetical protein
MPERKSKKQGRRSKKSTDAKQSSRIKSLENFVYKTIENKQSNYDVTNQNITSTPYNNYGFIKLAIGAEDGANYGDPARIGNSITLMRQVFNMNIALRSSSDEFNQIRVIIAEALEGTQILSLSNVLTYNDYSVHGNLVFNSPYTTKTGTNQRYKIHLDKHIVLNPYNKSAVNLTHSVNYKGGKVIDFDGPTVDFPTNHRMNIWVLGDSTSVQHPRLDLAVRSTYKDA